jgi:chaperonin GroES
MFKPLGNRILVLQDEADEKINGIIIPDQLKKNPPKGKVEMIGTECTEVKAGDIVYYNEYSGSPLKVDGKEYLIMRETEIHGIYTEGT